jgi:hypothetical protein
MTRALSRIRTATPATSCANCCHSAVLGEYESPFLNVVHRSVNRKVQGSNPCSGAKSDVQVRLMGHKTPSADAWSALVCQRCFPELWPSARPSTLIGRLSRARRRPG